MQEVVGAFRDLGKVIVVVGVVAPISLVIYFYFKFELWKKFRKN